MAQKYVTLKIPRELAELIDECMKRSNAGYRSRAELVKEAVRDKLLKCLQFQKQNKSSQ